MDGDLEKSLDALLSDPEQMGKLAQMAQKFLGGNQEQADSGAQEAPESDARLLGVLGRVLKNEGQEKSWTPLMKAMRPFLRPERQEKLDKALRIAKAVHIAGSVIGETGGAEHGL